MSWLGFQIDSNIGIQNWDNDNWKLIKWSLGADLLPIGEWIRECPPPGAQGPGPARQGTFEALGILLVDCHRQSPAVKQLLLGRHLPLRGIPLAPRSKATSQVLYGHARQPITHRRKWGGEASLQIFWGKQSLQLRMKTYLRTRDRNRRRKDEILLMKWRKTQPSP